MINFTVERFPDWVAEQKRVPLSKLIQFKMSFRPENVHCDGKPLRSPMIQIGKCPNDTHGCDEPPMSTDLPPLPPPPRRWWRLLNHRESELGASPGPRRLARWRAESEVRPDHGR